MSDRTLLILLLAARSITSYHAYEYPVASPPEADLSRSV